MAECSAVFLGGGHWMDRLDAEWRMEMHLTYRSPACYFVCIRSAFHAHEPHTSFIHYSQGPALFFTEKCQMLVYYC